MTPPTAREALAELARRLEHQDDATWLPPASVARLVREFAATIPDEAGRPGMTPDGLAAGGIVHQPAQALIGEHGPEFVINVEVIGSPDQIAAAIRRALQPPMPPPAPPEPGSLDAVLQELETLRAAWATWQAAAATPPTVDEWSAKVAAVEQLRAELARVRDAPLARRHADGSLTVEWAEGHTSCLMAREVLDGLLLERAAGCTRVDQLKRLLAEALDGWRDAHGWAEDIDRIRREAGLT